MVSKFLIIIILFSNFCLSYSHRYGSELYQDGKNARSTSMGGLSISYLDGYNATLLKEKQKSFIYFSNKNKYGGLVKVSSLSLFSQKGKIPFYLGLINRSVVDIPDTRLAWMDNNENSYPEVSEINYFNINEIAQKEIGISISTFKFFETYSMGFTIKPNITKLAEFWSYGLAFDVSTLIQLTKKVNLMVRSEDILAFKYWDSGSYETYAPLLMGGLHYGSSKMNMGLEVGARLETDILFHYHMGFELIKHDLIILRLGTSHNNQITFGIGIKTPIINIDYAYICPVQDIPLDLTHIFSLKILLIDSSLWRDKIKP